VHGVGPRFDAVLLDAGGVLLLPDPGRVRAVLAPFGAGPDDEACRRCHYVWISEFDRLGGVHGPGTLRVAVTDLGVAEHDLDEATAALMPFYSFSSPAPGVVQALRLIEETGVALGVVSNSDGTVEQRLREFGVCSVDGGDSVRVEVIVDSGTVGVEKPDPRIFDFALEALGVTPGRTLYVGDTVCMDVRGASAAGLVPLHLDPYGLCSDGSHRHVATLAAVAGLI
jgi:putative hydrolase of the HAD superfamily